MCNRKIRGVRHTEYLRVPSLPANADYLRRQFFALVLIDQPCADRALERANFPEQFAAVVVGEIHIQHDIANIAVGLEILGRDIDVALEKYFVQAPSMPGTLWWTWLKRTPWARE